MGLAKFFPAKIFGYMIVGCSNTLIYLCIHNLPSLVLKARHLSGSAFCWIDVGFAWAGSGRVSPRFGIGCGRWTCWTFMYMYIFSIVRTGAHELHNNWWYCWMFLQPRIMEISWLQCWQRYFLVIMEMKPSWHQQDGMWLQTFKHTSIPLINCDMYCT